MLRILIKLKKLGPKGRLPKAPRPVPKESSEKGKEKSTSIVADADERMEIED